MSSIAIQSHAIDLGIAHLVDLSMRITPVLLIDTFERCFSMRKPHHLTDIKTSIAHEVASFPMVPPHKVKKSICRTAC